VLHERGASTLDGGFAVLSEVKCEGPHWTGMPESMWLTKTTTRRAPMRLLLFSPWGTTQGSRDLDGASACWGFE